MTQVDFIVAFSITIVVISFAILFVQNNFSNEQNLLRVSELDKTASFLGTQLFKTPGNPYDWYNTEPTNIGLMSEVNRIKVIFREIGGSDHIEWLELSIEPGDLENNYTLYERFNMSYVESYQTQVEGKVIIKFQLTFQRDEIKEINIFYFGLPTNNITYLSNITEVNIDAGIISEDGIKFISNKKCSALKNLPYSTTKNILGFKHEFKIELMGCDYGLEPPASANIILKLVSVLLENQSGKFSPEMAKVMVW